MADWPTTTSYAVGDEKPDLRMHVLEKQGNKTHDLTGFLLPKFTMIDIVTGVKKIDAATATIDDATNGILKYAWGATDLDTEARYRGWFTIEPATGKPETTTSVEINVKKAEERVMV